MELTAREVDIHVGQRMRQRRESFGVSQGQLGRHLGLTFSQVQKYEKGTNRIGAGRLLMIAEFLDVPVQYFFDGLDEEMAPARSGLPAAGDRGSEQSALNDAFRSIADPDTRRSVVALVCSLAAAGPDGAVRPGSRASRAPERPQDMARPR